MHKNVKKYHFIYIYIYIYVSVLYFLFSRGVKQKQFLYL